MKYRYLHLTVFTALVFFVILIGVGKSLYAVAQEKKEVETFLQQQQVATDLFVSPALPKVYSFEKTAAELQILPEYRALYKQNNDFAGWIEIAGTPIHLPVMYTPQDGEYYLRRFFDKSDNMYGTPFIDARCTVTPRSSNLYIHGHNMKDDEMFGTLPLYTDESYYQKHPIIEFNTLFEKGQYQIVSAFLSQYHENDDSPKLYYNYVDLRDDKIMEEFSLLVKDLSIYDTGFALRPGDEVITLITCSYHVNNGRMTVVAKKLT